MPDPADAAKSVGETNALVLERLRERDKQHALQQLADAAVAKQTAQRSYEQKLIAACAAGAVEGEIIWVVTLAEGRAHA